MQHDVGIDVSFKAWSSLSDNTIMINVVNCTMYRDNPYHELLYYALKDQYKPVKGSIDHAISAQKALPKGERQIFHVHWEEAIIQNVSTSIIAKYVSQYFIYRLNYFSKLGGYIVWTVHNITPHELKHFHSFLKIRQHLMKASDRILIHNTETINLLKEQGDFDVSKIFHLPHASYMENYGTPTLSSCANRKQILLFGKVRRYKGIAEFLNGFCSSDLRINGMSVLVRGGLIKNDSFGSELQASFNKKKNVILNFEHVPNEEVQSLFMNSACIVLPYTQFLTSGVLMAALTHGIPVIAPDVSQVREVLPKTALRFLFDPDEKDSAINAIKALNLLSDKDYKQLRASMMERAEHYHPKNISRSLGDIYDARYL